MAARPRPSWHAGDGGGRRSERVVQTFTLPLPKIPISLDFLLRHRSIIVHTYFRFCFDNTDITQYARACLLQCV